MCFQGSLNRKEDTQTSNVNTAVVIIPGDTTCQLEVCDVAVNKPFTRHQTGCYLELPTNTAGSIRRPSEGLQGQLIKSARNGISPASIIRAFKGSCVSNDV
jgi:hypothetical protein